MRITKILFRRYSRVTAFLAGGAVASLASWAVSPEPVAADQAEVSPSSEISKSLADEYEGYQVVSYAKWPGRPHQYQFKDADGQLVSSETLTGNGIAIKARGSCEALLVRGKEYVSIYCQ